MAVILSCILSAELSAQLESLVEIRQMDETFLQLSADKLNEPVKTPSGTELRVEYHGKHVRYVATHSDHTVYSNWHLLTPTQPVVVFSARDKKFHKVTNRVLIRVSDVKALNQIAKDTNAIRSKFYEGLGYSILWLSADRDPVRIAKRLQNDSRVESAEIQFERPRYFPM